MLILAGRWAVLAEQERWAEGRYLAVDLQLVCERNDTRRGGEIDRALTCLSAESIAPDADGNAVVARRARGVGQAHRRRLARTCATASGSPSRSSPTRSSNAAAPSGLTPLPATEAQALAKQSLRFLYRILFLLYAEASPELGVLPVGAQEYDHGYSLDRLRELVQVELATPQARTGTHLYDSLGVLFRLVDIRHAPAAPARQRRRWIGVRARD